MEDAKSTITYTGMKLSRSVLKVVESHVKKWVRRQRKFLFLAGESSFEVHLDNESTHCVICHIEVQIGPHEWSGIDEGRSVQEAVLNTLRHLKPKGWIELYRSPVLPTPLQVTA